MSWPAFLLRLAGKGPDQVEEQRRFQNNLGKMDELDDELDGLLDDIQETNKILQEKESSLSATASSIRPDPQLLKHLRDAVKEVPDETKPDPPGFYRQTFVSETGS